MTPKAKEKAIEAAASAASNPLILWTFAILLALVVLRFLVPGLLGGIWAKLSGWLGSGLDSAVDGIAGALGGKGLSQDVGRDLERKGLTTTQKVGALFAEGDRGLSDLLDHPIDYWLQ